MRPAVEPSENTPNSSPIRRRRNTLFGMQLTMITCILLFLAATLVDGGSELWQPEDDDDDMIEVFDTPAPAPKAPKDIIWLLNSDFELTNVTTSNNATVLATVADTTLIPYWLPGGAGVQILQSSSYQMSSFGPSVFAIHLNNPAASNGTQGSIATLNLTSNPHPATLYTVQYDCARHPDGPLNLLSSLRISSMSGITVNYYKLHKASYNATDSRSQITWNRQSFLYMGTGAPTSISFESMSEKYGPIIDNVVLLRGVHILRNGSAWTMPSFLLRMCTLFALMVSFGL